MHNKKNYSDLSKLPQCNPGSPLNVEKGGQKKKKIVLK